MANTTTITGNLTREPEIRYTRGEGQATTQLGVAVNRRWQDRTTQEWQESTSFFDVICWRDLAENVALTLTKGMRVVVTGRLEHRTWETEEGEHRSKVEITADEVGPSLRFATADVHGGAPGVGLARERRRRRCRGPRGGGLMVPWLITTWPGLTAHVAGGTARLAADPAVVVGAGAGVAACVGATVLRNRVALRRRRASSG